MLILMLAPLGCGSKPDSPTVAVPDAIVIPAPGAAFVAGSDDWVAQVNDEGAVQVHDAWGRPGCTPDVASLGSVTVMGAKLTLITADGRLMTLNARTCDVIDQSPMPSVIESVLSWAPEGRFFLAKEELSKVVYTADGQVAGTIDGRPTSVRFSPYADEVAWIDDRGCAMVWDIGGELSEVECGVTWVGFAARGTITATDDALHLWKSGERLTLCPASGPVLGARADIWISEFKGRAQARSLSTCALVWEEPLVGLVDTVFNAGDRVGFLGGDQIQLRRVD